MSRIVTVGEALGVLRTREIGTLAQLSDLAVGTGGAELNVAIGLARQGHEVTWMGRIGADGLGRRIVRDLRGEGVAVEAIVDPERPTGLLLKETPSPGRTRVTYHRLDSAGSRLRADDLDLDVIRAADLLHVTGITPALSASAADAIDRAVTTAVAAGVPVSFDINHRAGLWGERPAAPVYRGLASRATVLLGGVDELRILLGVDDGEDAEALGRDALALGPRTVVVTRGAAGAVLVEPGGSHPMEPVPATVVDTVGAGDAFVAGYLGAWLEGMDPIARLVRATRLGAAACEHPGDWEGAELRTSDSGPVER